ncbi:MAG: ABC transporter ATP-binding protein [Pseudomonadota bacterium]
MPTALLQSSQLRHRYGKTVALDGIDLTLRTGQVTALLGPNGAGKTTLIHQILGVLPVREGRLEILGLQPSDRNCRKRLGAMLQISGVQDNLTVIELMELFASFYPQSADFDAVLDEAGLGGLEKRKYQRLSGGQKQRVLYALAVVGNPDVLILDEPTTGLDPSARRKLWQAIDQRRQTGSSVLLCTHYLDEAEQLADHIVVLNRGRVRTQGSTDEIRAQVPRQQIRCRSDQPIAAIEALEDVQHVRQDNHRLDILVRTAEPVVRHLLQHDPALSELEVLRTTLETAFLALTNQGWNNKEAA